MTYDSRALKRYFRKWEFSSQRGLAFHIWESEDNWYLTLSLGFGKLYIPLWRSAPGSFEWGTMRKYGFYTINQSLAVCWGRRIKHYDFPWSWTHVRTSVQLSDGSFVPKSYEWNDEAPDGRAEYEASYTYILESGEVQNRVATFYVEEMEWRWKWLKSFRYPRKISRYIQVEFSDEVGERAGSWKGGCVGCSYDMKIGETPLETLERMECERKFK